MNSPSLPYICGDLLDINTHWMTLTNQCNIYCKYCFNYIHKEHEHMNTQLAVAIINNIVKLRGPKPLTILFFGGEPTINAAALFAQLDYLNRHNVAYTAKLLTNGIIKQSLLEQLVQEDKLFFQISFDGVKNNLRQSKNGDGDVMLNTMSTIAFVKSQHKPVLLRATIHNQNVNNMTDIIEFAHQFSVDAVAFAPICQFGDAVSNAIAQPSIEDYVENFYKAQELANKYSIQMPKVENAYLDKPLSEKSQIPFVWLPDGNVAITITYASSKAPGASSIIIGKYDQETDAIILDQEKLQALNNNFLLHKTKYCMDCKIVGMCKGLNNFSAYSTNTYVPEREKYFCDISREFLLGSEK